MEAYMRWYQDWADACVYAQECIPDVSFLYPKEPYSALVCIAAMSFCESRSNNPSLKRPICLDAPEQNYGRKGPCD